MRKLMVLPMAGLLALGVVGPVAAAPNVSNTSGSGSSIYGEWSSEGTYGYVSVGIDSAYGAFADIYEESGTWVECAPVDESPAPGKGPIAYDTTPGGEEYGFVGTRTWGYGYDVEIDISRRLETGKATGTIELYTETVDECNGIYGGDAVGEVGRLEVDVVGVGSVASFRGSSFFKLPSEFNGHSNYRGKERQATGSVVAGGSIDTALGYGYMSQVTWSEHVNN
jgi:hypothetical protein